METSRPNFRAKVICCECGEEVTHVCKSNEGKLREAILAMLTWAPERGCFDDEEFQEAFVEHGKRSGYINDGDAWTSEDERGLTPYGFFGSQAWSYPLFGNQDTARSFHAQINNVIRMCGFEPHELVRDAQSKIEDQRKEQIERREWNRMRQCWNPLAVDVKVALMAAARAAEADVTALPALLELAAVALPGEEAPFYADVARWAKRQAYYVDRDGFDAWLKDKN